MSAIAGTDIATFVAPMRRQRSLLRPVPWRTLGYSAFALSLAIELVVFAPYLARAGAMLLRSDWKWLGLAVVVELASMDAAAQTQRRMLASTGTKVSSCRMTRLTYAANAMNMTLPAGTAVSAGYVVRRMRSWGASGAAAGFTVLASGVLSITAFALLGIVGLAVAGGSSLSSIVSLGSSAIAVLALIVLLRRRPDSVLAATERGLITVNRVLRRNPATGIDALRHFAGELRAIHPRRRDWAVGFGQAELNWLADLAVLVAAGYAVGRGHLDLATAPLAYVAGMGTASLSPLPGGFGPADAAMTLVLSGGGVSAATATAAVLLYRLVSVVLVVAMGWIMWLASAASSQRQAVAA